MNDDVRVIRGYESLVRWTKQFDINFKIEDEKFVLTWSCGEYEKVRSFISVKACLDFMDGYSEARHDHLPG